MNTDFEALRAEAEEALAPAFRRIGRIAQKNTEKVLAAFRKNCVAATHFAASDSAKFITGQTISVDGGTMMVR